MENRIHKNFTITPNELINDANLSRDARFLFIYLCSKPEDWKFYTNTVQKDLGCSKDSRVKYMKELELSGWVSQSQKKCNQGKWKANDICLNPYPKKPDTEPRPKFTDAVKNGGGKSMTLNNTDLNNNTNLFTKTEDKISLPEIALSYLNEKRDSKTGFKPSDTNLLKLKSLFNENYTLDDVKAVIDLKIHEWQNNQKMKKYLRPETLFGSKFNSYLVEASDFNENQLSLEQEEFQYRPSKKVDLK